MCLWKNWSKSSKEEINWTFWRIGLKTDVNRIFKSQPFIMRWPKSKLILTKNHKFSWQPTSFMTPRLWADYAKVLTHIWLCSLTRETQAHAIANWLNAQTKTVFTEFKLNIWFKECPLNSGSRCFPLTMNTERILLTKLWALLYLQAKAQKKLSPQSKLSCKLNSLSSWWPCWKRLCSITANFQNTKNFKICWSLPQ